MYNLSMQKVGGGCGVSGGWAEFSSWIEKSRNQALCAVCFPSRRKMDQHQWICCTWISVIGWFVHVSKCDSSSVIQMYTSITIGQMVPLCSHIWLLRESSRLLHSWREEKICFVTEEHWDLHHHLTPPPPRACACVCLCVSVSVCLCLCARVFSQDVCTFFPSTCLAAGYGWGEMETNKGIWFQKHNPLREGWARCGGGPGRGGRCYIWP